MTLVIGECDDDWPGIMVMVVVDIGQRYDRHHICQKIYATAILGPKNLRKKSGICDKTK